MVARIRSSRYLLILATVGLVIAFVITTLVSRQGQPRLHARTGFEMGTLVQIKVYGDPEAGEVADLGFQRVREIERLMSTSIKDSDVSRLNSAPVGSAVDVHPDTAGVVSLAVRYAEMTEGRFDPTVGRLVSLWAIGSGREKVPSASEIQDALLCVGYENLVVDRENAQITRLSDFWVDLGAIAKGYASDEVARVLQSDYVIGGVIDLGGNIRAFGTNPDGRDWRIGIQDPFRPRGAYVGTVDIPEGAVATSGDYERYFEEDGIRYHHILDPATGHPASQGLKSLTVVAPVGIEADALSTGLFVLGVDGAFALAKERTSIELVAITADRRVIISSGIADSFRRISEDFTYEVR